MSERGEGGQFFLYFVSVCVCVVCGVMYVCMYVCMWQQKQTYIFL